MAELICHECTQDIQNQYVVTAVENDTILLPGVDSCMAVLFLLKNKSIIAGHVGMFGAGPLEGQIGNKCTENIVTEMLTKVSDKNSFQRLIVVTDIAEDNLFGKKMDPNYFDVSLPERLVKAVTSQPLLVTNIAKGGVNVDLEIILKTRIMNIKKNSNKKLIRSLQLDGLASGGVLRWKQDQA